MNARQYPNRNWDDALPGDKEMAYTFARAILPVLQAELERQQEECAKVADGLHAKWYDDDIEWSDAAEMVAQAIRQRGE